MEHTTFAVDLAKSVFQVAESLYPGQIRRTLRLTRSGLMKFFSTRAPATVVMEACGSAHHWGRQFESRGHRVVLLPPHAVRPYITGNKTDRNDAAGILEAFRNRALHPVPIKSVAQQTLVALHRVRSHWMASRTAQINMVRGLLRELGIVIPLGAHKVLPAVWAALEDADSTVPDALRPALAHACEGIRELEEKIRSVEQSLDELAEQMPKVSLLRTIPGIGILTATALVGGVGDIHRFRSCRQFASFVGLTPKERSSGHSRYLGRITKRGDSYLRTLLIHGARSILSHLGRSTRPQDRLRTWAWELRAARGFNKAAVALANKLARIVWAVWTRDAAYRSIPSLECKTTAQ